MSPLALALLVSEALAQEEACEPLTMAQLDALLDQAEREMAALEADHVRQLMEVATKQLPCLTELIGRQSFARYALLRAHLAFNDQDDLEAERWMTAARFAVDELPWKIGIDHPFRYYAEGLRLKGAVPLKGKRFLVRGAVFLDGVFLDRPLAPLEVQGLVQRFEGKKLVESFWQDGARFREGWIEDGEGVVRPPSWLGGAKVESAPFRLQAALLAGGGGVAQSVDPSGDFLADASDVGPVVGLSLSGRAPIGPLSMGWGAAVPIEPGAPVAADGWVGAGLRIGPVFLHGGPAVTTASWSSVDGTTIVPLPQPHLEADLDLPVGPLSLAVHAGGGWTLPARHVGAGAFVAGPMAGKLSWLIGVDFAYTGASFVDEALDRTLTTSRWRAALSAGIRR